MTCMEMGQRMGGRDHLQRAEAIVAVIGANLDLAETRKLLDR